MKRALLYIITAFCGLTTACDDFHTSSNGALDGYWQLATVDTLANGHSGDVRHLQYFWSVQADLLKMVNLGSNDPIKVLFRFDLHDKQLTLSNPIADNRPISDSIITDVNTIRPYGLNHLTETLQVLELTHKKMTLQSERLRMYFRKY